MSTHMVCRTCWQSYPVKGQEIIVLLCGTLVHYSQCTCGTYSNWLWSLHAWPKEHDSLTFGLIR